ncbi:MAG: hypothetical protein J5I47_13390 [Vicingus serpentipes]|nr:hypothetical protein [Vicingus serpentipes]
MKDPKIIPALYYNDPQLAIKLCHQPHKMFVAGRGIGKTTIFADEMLDLGMLMPRAKFAFMGLTYFHVRTKSMPAIIDQWERRGIYRNIHYWIGHKAPKKYKIPEPYLPPLDYSNCIQFWDGTVIEFISFDRPEMARSGSYDYMFGDEASKLKYESLSSDVLPANRGNNLRFKHIQQHHGTLFATTMPLDLQGQWVFEYQELMEEFPDQYLYLEASSYENEYILGEKYFRDLKRVLPSPIFDLEIKNIRRKLNVKTFYPMLGDRHFYTPVYDYDYIDSKNVLTRSDLSRIENCNKDADLNKDVFLDISLDFGSNINCLVVGQQHGNEYRLLKNFYGEKPIILDTVVENFCKYYEPHKKKVVYMYGGSDGRKSQANSVTNLFEDVTKTLEKNGWMVIPSYQIFEADHMDKYRFFNKFLSEANPNVPCLRINEENCKETIVSMQDAPIEPSNFKKDKKSEKDKNIPQWKATHLSDTVDNLLYWKFKNQIDDEYLHSGPPTGAR